MMISGGGSLRHDGCHIVLDEILELEAVGYCAALVEGGHRLFPTYIVVLVW